MVEQAVILAHVAAHPGLGVREIARAIRTSPSGASVHLRRLVDAGRLERRRDGLQWTHYLPGTPSRTRPLSAPLGELVDFLRGRSVPQREVVNHFSKRGWPRSTTQHRLHRLVTAHIVRRRHVDGRDCYGTQ